MVDDVTITTGNITFDRATYDDRGEVPYLHVGDRQAADDALGTLEGDAVRYNATGHVIGENQNQKSKIPPARGLCESRRADSNR